MSVMVCLQNSCFLEKKVSKGCSCFQYPKKIVRQLIGKKTSFIRKNGINSVLGDSEHMWVPGDLFTLQLSKNAWLKGN